MYKCEVETPENGTQWVLMMPVPEVQIDLDREQRPNVFRDSPCEVPIWERLETIID